MSYNPFQTMHYQALYGSTSKKKSEKVTAWKLLYNDQETGARGLYPVCKAKENSLRATGNYSRGEFKIVPNK